MADQLVGPGIGPGGEQVDFYATGRLNDYCVKDKNGKNIISGDMTGLNLMGYRMVPGKDAAPDPEQQPGAQPAPDTLKSLDPSS